MKKWFILSLLTLLVGQAWGQELSVQQIDSLYRAQKEAIASMHKHHEPETSLLCLQVEDNVYNRQGERRRRLRFFYNTMGAYDWFPTYLTETLPQASGDLTYEVLYHQCDQAGSEERSQSVPVLVIKSNQRTGQQQKLYLNGMQPLQFLDNGKALDPHHYAGEVEALQSKRRQLERLFQGLLLGSWDEGEQKETEE